MKFSSDNSNNIPDNGGHRPKHLWCNINNATITVSMRFHFARRIEFLTRWHGLPWLHISNQQGGSQGVARCIIGSRSKKTHTPVFTQKYVE